MAGDLHESDFAALRGHQSTLAQLLAILGPNQSLRNTYDPGFTTPSPPITWLLRIWCLIIGGITLDARFRWSGLCGEPSSETGFGAIDAGLNGTKALKNDLQAVAGSPFTSLLATQGRLFFNASLGATVGSSPEG